MALVAKKTKSIVQIDDFVMSSNCFDNDDDLLSLDGIESSDEYDSHNEMIKVDDEEEIKKQKDDFNKRFELIFGSWVTSTMTVISDIGQRVDLKLLYENLPHIRCKEKCKSCSETAKEILSIRFRDYPQKGKQRRTITVRKNSKTHRVFFNQITLDIEIEAGRKVSIKLFIDGKIQMAGCKNEEDAHKTVMILIKYLKKIGDIEEPGTVTLPLNEDEYKIMLKMKETMNKNKWRNYVYNKKSEHIKASILAKMNKYEIPIIRKAVEDKNKMKPQYFKIAMINSDFKVNMRDNEDGSVKPVTIDREVLRNLLHNKYGVYCAPYEASRYPGVNAKKISSIDCVHGCNNEKGNPSMCAFNMKKKKVVNGCVTVSILAFQQGKIILTGAQSTRQLDDTYDFITKVYRDNFFELKTKEKKTITVISDIDSDSDGI